MTSPSQAPASLSDHEFERIRTMVESQLGVQVPPGKRSMIQARIARRYRELGFEKARDYCAYLFGDGAAAGETTHLLDVVTTNFTYFYREPQQLDSFAAELLPGLLDQAHRERRPLRVWSAACSTGEEVWTLAMMIEAARERAGIGQVQQLWATDVSTRVLQTAVRAVYRADDLHHLPEDWRRRYFHHSKNATDRRVRVAPSLRACVTFHHLNLMTPPYPVPRDQDVIFLRNILIYFDRDTRREVVGNVAQHLRPGGYLFLGASETLNGLGLPLVYAKRSIYRKGP